MKSFEYGFELTYESQRIEIGKLDNVYPVGILVMDLNDLKKFNGKNAEKAYVAVEGNVYDLTFLKAWKNGEHMNLHTAGNELTYDILKRSPHGLKKLEKALKVGTLIFWSIPEGYSKENFVVFKDGLKIGYLIH
jgi:predicted heme/steroid binding protein